AGEQTSPSGESVPGRERRPGLDLHDLGFFPGGDAVHPLDVGLGELLKPAMGTLRVVLRKLAFLLHGVDAMELVPANVSDRHPGLLGLVAYEPHVFLASLFGEGWNRDPDDLAVAGRVQPLLSRTEGLLDRADLALVVDLHHQEPGLGRADLRELVERRRGAVIRDHDLVDQGRVGATGPDGGQLGPEVVDRFRHLRLGVTQDRIDHPKAPTSVPISSPRTTRSILPGSRRLKTTMGTLLSMHRVSAVLSIALMPGL